MQGLAAIAALLAIGYGFGMAVAPQGSWTVV